MSKLPVPSRPWSPLPHVYRLSEMAAAFEKVDPKVTASSGRYDIVLNNCATYLVDLASAMGVHIDGRIISFAARRLVASSGVHVFDAIRQSMSFLKHGNMRHRSLQGLGEGEENSAQGKNEEEQLLEFALAKKQSDSTHSIY